MRQIILEVPDGVMCIGAFINYKTEEQQKTENGSFTTTNFLMDPSTSNGVRVNEDGSLTKIEGGKS